MRGNLNYAKRVDELLKTCCVTSELTLYGVELKYLLSSLAINVFSDDLAALVHILTGTSSGISIRIFNFDTLNVSIR